MLSLQFLVVISLLFFSYDDRDCESNSTCTLSNTILDKTQVSNNSHREYFKKLSIKMPSLKPPKLSNVGATFDSIPPSELTADELAMTTNYSEIGEFFFQYLSMERATQEVLLSCLPRELLELERPIPQWQLSRSEKALMPHVDYNRITAINFYYLVNDEITVFFVNATKYAYFGRSIMFLESWLTEAARFIAVTNDVMLLDVTVIHTVKSTSSDYTRISASLGFQTLSYARVLEVLRRNNFTVEAG